MEKCVFLAEISKEEQKYLNGGEDPTVSSLTMGPDGKSCTDHGFDLGLPDWVTGGGPFRYIPKN